MIQVIDLEEMSLNIGMSGIPLVQIISMNFGMLQILIQIQLKIINLMKIFMESLKCILGLKQMKYNMKDLLSALWIGLEKLEALQNY